MCGSQRRKKNNRDERRTIICTTSCWILLMNVFFYIITYQPAAYLLHEETLMLLIEIHAACVLEPTNIHENLFKRVIRGWMHVSTYTYNSSLHKQGHVHQQVTTTVTQSTAIQSTSSQHHLFCSRRSCRKSKEQATLALPKILQHTWNDCFTAAYHPLGSKKRRTIKGITCFDCFIIIKFHHG